MLKRFYPDRLRVIRHMRFRMSELYKKGYRGIVFDVDNTLVEHGAPVTERAVATCLTRLHERQDTIPVSFPIIKKHACQTAGRGGSFKICQ